MTSQLTAAIKIKACIESCITLPQLDCCFEMIEYWKHNNFTIGSELLNEYLKKHRELVQIDYELFMMNLKSEKLIL